jgi:hypothetical protein
VKPASKGELKANSIPTFAISRFFSFMASITRPRALWCAMITARRAQPTAAFGHLVHSWDINGLFQNNRAPAKNPAAAFLLRHGSTRPAEMRGMFPACYHWLGSKAARLSHFMFTQETPAIAPAATLEEAMAGRVFRVLFVSTKYDSAVKNTSKSNVQHN